MFAVGKALSRAFLKYIQFLCWYTYDFLDFTSGFEI